MALNTRIYVLLQTRNIWYAMYSDVTCTCSIVSAEKWMDKVKKTFCITLLSEQWFSTSGKFLTLLYLCSIFLTVSGAETAMKKWGAHSY